jgi:integrase
MLFSSEEKSDIRLYIAIGLFAGLRPTEIQRLNFSDINLEDKTILLPAKKTKTSKKRAVIINDTLKAWLVPYIPNILKGGSIINPNFRRRFTEFRKANNIKWVYDGLRHSYGTYFYALTSNEYETAKQMGNSPHIVKEHYANQRIIKEVAEKYFSILPNSTKITPVAEILKESATA